MSMLGNTPSVRVHFTDGRMTGVQVWQHGEWVTCTYERVEFFNDPDPDLDPNDEALDPSQEYTYQRDRMVA